MIVERHFEHAAADGIDLGAEIAEFQRCADGRDAAILPLFEKPVVIGVGRGHAVSGFRERLQAQFRGVERDFEVLFFMSFAVPKINQFRKNI